MGRIGPKHHQSHTTHLHWVPRIILDFPSRFSWSFRGNCFGKKRGIRVNPWVELVQSTTKVILHISTDFQGYSLEIKQLLECTLWVELSQSTAKVILHISAEFQEHFSWSKRFIRVNPWVELVHTTASVHSNISIISRKMSLKLSGDL